MTGKEEMMQKQLEGRGIHDENVLNAMWKVDRSKFVPEDMIPYTYEDRPLPIGKNQTISQPYIVAYMAQELHLQPGDAVLEIGAGCGYNAAVLAQIASHVYSIEIIGWLADLAKENLQKAGVENVTVFHDDGYKGLPEKAPFDAIILTAAPPEIPEALLQQLKIGGKLLAPVGRERQYLKYVERKGTDEFDSKGLLMVSFVPMTGEIRK